MNRKHRIDALMETGLLCSCFGSPPDPPDYSGASEASAEVQKRSLDLSKEQFEWSKGEAEKNRKILEEQLAITTPAMKAQAEAAQRAQERYEQHYIPLEDIQIEEALGYDTPERRARERAEAISQVGQSFAATRENAQRRLEDYGVDPSQTRSQALDVAVSTAEAATKAQAGRQAVDRVEDMGRAIRADTIGVGRGLPSQVAQSYGTALQAGQQGTGSALATTGTGASTMGTAPQYLGLANQGALTQGRILNAGYGNQLAGWKAQQAASPWNAIGQVAGMGAKGYFGGTWTPFGADGGMLPPAAAFFDGGLVDPHVDQESIHFFDGGVVTDGSPVTAGVRTASYADGGSTAGAIHGRATTTAGLRPLSFSDGGLPPRGALSGSGGPGMGGVTGPQRTTAGLRRLADGGTGQTHAPGGDSSYQGSRANVRYPLGNSGGLITGLGDGSGIDDSIPAQVSAGEYVIPADVVHIKGREFFDKLLEKYHTPAAEQEAADTPPPNLGVPAVPMAADGGQLPRQVPAHYGATKSPLPPASGGAGYMDGGAIYLTGGRGGNPDKRVHRRA